MDYNRLAELLFPEVTETPEEVEARYPERPAGGRKGHSYGPKPDWLYAFGQPVRCTGR